MSTASWFDHPRDLLHFINLKRDEMPRPIIGVGHSFGGAQLYVPSDISIKSMLIFSTQLSLIHPRLLHTLILLDPVIQRQSTTLDEPSQLKNKQLIAKTTQLSTYRRDRWPSRKAAAESFSRSPFYQAWDPRVLDKWIQYGLRDLPTAIHPLNTTPNSNERPVTLKTTLHQEVFTYSRPNYDGPPGNPTALINKTTHPDLDPNNGGTSPFYRPESMRVFAQLPHVRPSVLYIFGGKSDMCAPAMMADKMRYTGIGWGGSGGVEAGRVRDVYLAEIGHLVAQEAPVEAGEAAAGWLGGELKRWREDEEAFREQWKRKSAVQKVTIDDRWKQHVPRAERKPRSPPGEESKSKL